jgi:hypothetical protein
MRALMLFFVLAAAGFPQVTVAFRETDAVFANPGKGWMTGRRLAEPRFPTTVTYFRLIWADLEPAEGRFDWSLIDTPIEAAQKRGMRIAFRIMTTNAHSQGYYSSPKWLFDAGCKSFEYLVGGDDPTKGGQRIQRIEPDYSDSIYLDKHGRFLAALGKRYDGHRAVEFLDVGSYGIWGEWHTPHPVAIEVRRKIVDMYLDAFKRTPLMMMSDDAEALAYALPKGAGYRRDGVGSPGHEKSWIGSPKYAGVPGFADAWKKSPVVFEWYGNYEYLQSRQWSFDRAIHFMLDNHVTLINDNVGAVPPDQMPKLMKLARLAGYRFVLREASHAPRVAPGERLSVRMKWSNTGVGLLYREYFLEQYLLDAEGRIVERTRAAADPRAWLPGDREINAELAVGRNVKPGTYGLGIALADPSGKPAIRLAIDAPESALVYKVSQVRVAAR